MAIVLLILAIVFAIASVVLNVLTIRRIEAAERSSHNAGEAHDA